MKYLQVMNFIKQNEPKQVSQAIAAKSQMQKMKASEFVRPQVKRTFKKVSLLDL